MRLLLSLAVFTSLALPQSQPQLAWEGEVDGISILHIRGNRIDVEDRRGAPVARDRHHFQAPLPEMRQDVQMQVGRGRGQIRILAQPRPDNNYTFSVQIEDHQTGQGPYSLAFFWRTLDRTPSPSRPFEARYRGLQRGEERVTWSGRIDHEAWIECSGGECRAREMRGSPVARERVNFTRPLPDREIRVSLDDVQGRGSIRMAEQPNPSNGYTAKVRILDSDGGAGDYAFSLYWTPLRQSEPNRLFSRSGARWSGRVDGTVRIWMQGTSAGTDVVSGAPVQQEQIRFERPMEDAPMPNFSAKRLRGRGRVEVVQFPSRQNGFRAVIEIVDTSGGNDIYEVEVGW